MGFVLSGFGDRLGNREGTLVAEVIDQLEGGTAPAQVAAALNLDAIDVVAALAYDALGDEGSEGLTLVQTDPRRPKLEPALGENGLAQLWPHASRPAVLALAAGLLQIHDFWDASHNAAQTADDLGEKSVSPYWHGIGHRREPDAGNATYWFRRVGRHRLFPKLADAAKPLIQSVDPSFKQTLMPGGGWDPFAFIDLCTRRAAGNVALARKLQRLEMLLLLRASLPS
jgi:hypothetical protein